MSDELLQTIPVLAVIVELIAIAWAFARRNMNGVVLVNALGAVALIALVVPELRAGVQFDDVLVLLQFAVLAFALATLATSLSWVAHQGGRALAVWTEFSVLAGLSVALLSVVLILKLARLA
jgi:hypothetical protein